MNYSLEGFSLVSPHGPREARMLGFSMPLGVIKSDERRCFWYWIQEKFSGSISVSCYLLSLPSLLSAGGGIDNAVVFAFDGSRYPIHY